MFCNQLFTALFGRGVCVGECLPARGFPLSQY